MSVRVLRGAWFVLLLLASVIPGGCSVKSNVSGTVTYKGKPLPSGSVTFFGADNKQAAAPINPDGSYTATSVPIGPAKVAVRVQPSMAGLPTAIKTGVPGAAEHTTPGMETASTPSVDIPKKYGSPETSDLSLDVRSGNNTFDIDLK
jgi:hypothetical protein